MTQLHYQLTEKILNALVLNNNMRALLFLVLVLQMLFGGIMMAHVGQAQEIRLIRRAYLDVTGVLPTPEEMDWLVVYNTDGYNKAVEHLTTKYRTGFTPEYLLSGAYTTTPAHEIPVDTLRRSVLYLVGIKASVQPSEQEYTQGKQRLIHQALLCTSSVDDAIDYMCNLLMSRVSNTQENNMLARKFKDVVALSNEQRAWTCVLEEILKLPDVCTK
jgi:hypothetical protein